MSEDSRREAKIRRVLRQLARQRVALVLNPGNVWVIEKAVEDDERTDAALKTCYIRGWLEPLSNAIPKGRLTDDGRIPDTGLFDRIGPIYRLTDSGWSVINRSQLWALATVAIGTLALLVSIIAMLVTRTP